MDICLQEELSVLKRQNVSRSLSFRTAIFEDTKNEASGASTVEKLPVAAKRSADELHSNEGSARVSQSQVSVETLDSISYASQVVATSKS